MYLLGDMYANGHGVKLDLAEAENWYVKSVENAKHEIDKEMFALGSKFYFGDKVLQNYGKAEHWFLKSEKSGNIHAAHSLGLLDFEIHKNYHKALAWFEIAATRNDVESQIMAGTLYALTKKEWRPRDFKKGAYWCRCALENTTATASQREEARSCLKTIKNIKDIW